MPGITHGLESFIFHYDEKVKYYSVFLTKLTSNKTRQFYLLLNKWG
jgi:hypothetical protein